jgi:hypothetical protein
MFPEAKLWNVAIWHEARTSRVAGRRRQATTPIDSPPARRLAGASPARAGQALKLTPDPISPRWPGPIVGDKSPKLSIAAGSADGRDACTLFAADRLSERQLSAR